jgi:hypothetical protein
MLCFTIYTYKLTILCLITLLLCSRVAILHLSPISLPPFLPSNHQLFDQLAFPFTNLFMSSYQKKYFFPLTPASLPSCQRCVPFLSRWAQMGSAASYQTYGAVSVSNGARPASYHWSPAGDYMGSRAPGTLVNGQLTPKLLSYTMSATHPSDVW